MSERRQLRTGDPTQEKGVWCTVRIAGGAVEVPKLSCPECGFVSIMLPQEHVVDCDGNVSPSVVCPECEFHEMVQFVGWRER